MSIHFYKKEKPFILGVTLRSPKYAEDYNMGLHVAKKKDDVIANRNDLATKLGYSLNDFVFMNQTHSANFYEVTEQNKGNGTTSLKTAIRDTDALFTFCPNIVLTVLTADCVPILFYNEKSGVIGAIHSGWRGTVEEITYKTLNYLIEKRKCHPKDFHIYIGLALSKEKFEVEEDVASKFQRLHYATPYISYKREMKKFHIDNQLVVREQCLRLGISKEQIYIDRKCTFLSDIGFSYRENNATGRHASFIVRKE